MSSDGDSFSVDVPTMTFSGDPQELLRVLMHVRLKRALDSDLEVETVRCAYLASTFRGKAMDWFVRSLPTNPLLLTSYDVLESLLQEVFGETDEIRKARAQREITHLRHTGSVQAYTAEFESLADMLEWPQTARHAFYYQGLKADLKDRLIAVDPADYSALKREATKLEGLVTIAKTSAPPSSSSGTKSKRKSKKCTRCRRKGHTTSDCHAKTKADGTALAVNAIRVAGQEEAEAWQYSEVEISGRRFRPLVDSGSAVSVVSRAKTWKW